MENALRSLRDVDGVLGSFLLDQHGHVLARDMPGIFDEVSLRSASQRLSQLRAAFEADGHPFEGCTARFGGHLLVLRSAGKRTLCVLCPVGTNMTTLQMGINLVSRRAQELPERASPRPPPAMYASLPPAAAPGSLPVPQASAPWTHGQQASPPPTFARAPEGALRPLPSLELPLHAEVPAEPQPTTRFFRGRPVL